MDVIGRSSDPGSPKIISGAGVAEKTLKEAKGVDEDPALWQSRLSTAKLISGHAAEKATRAAANKGQGLWFGVIFPITSNIYGVILFLRAPWIVGKAGIANAFGLVLVCCTCTFVTAMSLSAVATNGKILGGGSYYIISRSLGPALGAGVGLCVYMANSIGAAMYLMGTVEAWEMAQPSAQIFAPGDINNIRVTAIILLIFAVLVVAMGVKYVSRLGTTFLFTSLTVIFCMYLGCFIGPDKAGTQPSVYTLNVKDADGVASTVTLTWGGIAKASQYFSENFGPAWEEPQLGYAMDTKVYSFLSMMGLWFPANTCIMAGSNRSADLADPSRDIPRGTLFAQVTTSIVYLSLIVIYGCIAPRHTLLNDKFFASTACWPFKEVLLYGVMASTIDAAFASLVSGSRLLNAIASDKTVPILRHFAAPPGKEPYRALASSGVLGICAICIGELNSVAPILTMFFLMCYTCVNASCTILEAVQDPNWRPTFRFHHWSISLFGTCLCLFMMFSMDALRAAIAIIFCFCVMTYTAYHSHAVKWGDGFQGMKFQLAKNILMKMHLTAHTKNWRPQLLVIAEASVVEGEKEKPEADGELKPENGGVEKPEKPLVNTLKIQSPDLLKFVSQLKGGRGITILGGICEIGDVSTLSEDFPRATNELGVDDGRGAVKKVLTEFGIEGFGQLLYTDDFVEGVKNMIQTAGLGAFQPNCVMMSWPEEAAWKARDKSGLATRSKTIRTVQSAVVFNKVMLMAKGETWPNSDEKLVGNIDIWWIVGDGGMLLLLPFLLKKNKVWNGCKTRLFVLTDKSGSDPMDLGQNLKSYVKDFRLDVEVFVQVLDTNDMMETGDQPSAVAAQGGGAPRAAALDALIRQLSPTGQSGLARQFSEGKILKTQGTEQDLTTRHFVTCADQLDSARACSTQELAIAAALGAVVAKESKDADLVISNLPDMPPDESAYGYFEIVDAMTKGLKRCLLVRGTTEEIITQFT